MEIVVPLAGPDFELANGTTKAELLMGDDPLLVRALTTRSWWQRGEVSDRDLVFVLKNSALSRAFVERSLLRWFPEARTVFLSHPTQGATFSALAGVALCEPTRTLCIDLADILYTDYFEPEASFAADPALGGVVPTFPSDWPYYSYVMLADDGRAIRTAEKEVISTHASAGTYFFRDSSVFTTAVGHAVRKREQQTFNDSYFVCPLFNGVIASDLVVRTTHVFDIIDVKKDVVLR